jgi:hypothetical protein
MSFTFLKNLMKQIKTDYKKQVDEATAIPKVRNLRR